MKDTTYDLFYCNIIATKAVPEAKERLKALHGLGFVASEKIIVSQDGTKYGDYYILENNLNGIKNLLHKFVFLHIIIV